MKPGATLGEFDALIFDVYGTLMDWEAGIHAALRPMLDRASSSWSKKEALAAFEAAEKDLQVQHPSMPYNELLVAVHKEFAARLGCTSTTEEDTQFGASIGQWSAFSDTVAALAQLKRHYNLIVLSNVDNSSFHTFTRKVLEPNPRKPIFDLVITAQDVGAYKPDTAGFKFALEAIRKKLGVESGKVLVTAQSLFHDHKPANVLGLHSVWIARDGAVMGLESDATYDFKFATLGEMAEARRTEETSKA